MNYNYKLQIILYPADIYENAIFRGVRLHDQNQLKIKSTLQNSTIDAQCQLEIVTKLYS